MIESTEINLHIGQLILQELDLPRSQRPQIQIALTEELNRLITENGLPLSLQSGGLIPRLSITLDSASLQPTPSESATYIGQKIAQSAYSELTSQPSTPR